MSKFAQVSHVVLDMIPASIDSSGANATNTPAELILSASDIWECSNLRLKLQSDLVLDASDTVTVTTDIKRTDRDGSETTLETVTVVITAGTRGQASKYVDISAMQHDDTLRLTTTTTVLGTANYQVFNTLIFEAPFQVN